MYTMCIIQPHLGVFYYRRPPKPMETNMPSRRAQAQVAQKLQNISRQGKTLVAKIEEARTPMRADDPRNGDTPIVSEDKYGQL